MSGYETHVDRPPFRTYPMTHETPARRDTSPATTPPRLGSSAWTDDFGPDDWATPTQRAETLELETDAFTAVNNTFPPIPALIPTHILENATPSASAAGFDAGTAHELLPLPSHVSRDTSRPATPSGSNPALGGQGRPRLDLSTVPRRRANLEWPFKYFVDMADGFDLIREWEASHPGKHKPGVAFTAALGITFVSTTWNDHYRAWDAGCQVEGQRAYWTKLGRSKEGEWMNFFRIWGPRRRGN